MLTGCNIGRIIQLSNQFNKEEENVNIDEMTYGELKQIRETIEKEVEDAVVAAMAAPEPKPEDALEDMFVEPI